VRFDTVDWRVTGTPTEIKITVPNNIPGLGPGQEKTVAIKVQVGTPPRISDKYDYDLGG
jgi:hypothetical protein